MTMTITTLKQSKSENASTDGYRDSSFNMWYNYTIIQVIECTSPDDALHNRLSVISAFPLPVEGSSTDRVDGWLNEGWKTEK